MTNGEHPFYAVAALAASRGMDNLELRVERDGAFVRLIQNDPPIFFRYKPDPVDSIDRISLDRHKRLMLSEADCANGPKATLGLITELLDKFADYGKPPAEKKPMWRPKKNPKSGRDQ